MSSGIIGCREFVVGGKYRLVRKIGSGSFGDIYLGINITNGEVGYSVLFTCFVLCVNCRGLCFSMCFFKIIIFGLFLWKSLSPTSLFYLPRPLVLEFFTIASVYSTFLLSPSLVWSFCFKGLSFAYGVCWCVCVCACSYPPLLLSSISIDLLCTLCVVMSVSFCLV